MKVDKLFIYPVKSTAGIEVAQAEVTPTGLLNDRIWMLVDERGKFVSQRQLPKMALISSKLEVDSLQLYAPDMEALKVPFEQSGNPLINVKVWRDDCQGILANDVINQWLSEFLEHKVRLVKYDFDAPRATDPEYSKPGDIVSYADGFPLLITNRSSLDDLNSRLQQPVTMSAFRPNIVIQGAEAYSEDNWNQITIGTMTFDVVKPCARCLMTTIDPETGIKRSDGEPLKTLAQYRKKELHKKGLSEKDSDKKEIGIFFGMNLIPSRQGCIGVGDKVTIAH